MAVPAAVLHSLQLLVVGRYFDMAAGCLVIFDSFLTLPLEVEFIWGSEMSLMKGMYFVNRYSTILEFMLSCIRSTVTDTKHCSGLMKTEGVVYLLGIYIAEYTFAMRTFVIWEKSKIIFIPLCLFYAGTLIYNFISYYTVLNHAQYFLVSALNGCLAQLPPSNLWIGMLLMVVHDTAMIMLIGFAALDVWKRGTGVHSDLFRVLYGEGVLFYVYLLAFSVMSLVAFIVANPYLFIFMGRCVRAILASRVILHLRQTARPRFRELEEVPISSWRSTAFA